MAQTARRQEGKQGTGIVGGPVQSGDMESFTPYLAREHIADLRREAHRPVPKAPKGALRRTRGGHPG